MEEKLLIASRNRGKVEEFRAILKQLPVEILSLDNYPEVGDIPETGNSFEENALLKAATAARISGLLTVADDSGLEVDCLDGAPGVYSARFAGEDRNDNANIDKLLSLLRDIPQEERTARFRCVLAIVSPQGVEKTVEGKCEGLITVERRGEGGFGYDPVFLVPAFGRTMAELSPDQKNAISHRAQALAKAEPVIRSSLNNFNIV